MDIAILEQALALPDDEKVFIAEKLLSSVTTEDKTFRDAWLDEVKNRMKSVNEGTSKLLDFGQLYYEDSNS